MVKSSLSVKKRIADMQKSRNVHVSSDGTVMSRRCGLAKVELNGTTWISRDSHAKASWVELLLGADYRGWSEGACERRRRVALGNVSL